MTKSHTAQTPHKTLQTSLHELRTQTLQLYTTRESNTTARETSTHPLPPQLHNQTQVYMPRVTAQGPIITSTHKRNARPESRISHLSRHTHHNHTRSTPTGPAHLRSGGVVSPSLRLGLTLCTRPGSCGHADLSRPRARASTVPHTAAAAISIGRSELGRCACGGDETGRQASRRLSSAESSRQRKGRMRIRIVEGGPAASAQALSERGRGRGRGEEVGLGNFVRFSCLGFQSSSASKPATGSAPHCTAGKAEAGRSLALDQYAQRIRQPRSQSS